MALGRYVAVCKPLHARGFISVGGTRIAIVSVFVASVLFNLPRFWHYVATPTPCSALLPPSAAWRMTVDFCPSCLYYRKEVGELYNTPTFVALYSVACSVVAILFPLPVLTVCNVCLVRALRRSRLLQKQYRATNMRCRSVRSANSATDVTTRGGTADGRCSPAGRHRHGGGQTSSHHRITPPK